MTGTTARRVAWLVVAVAGLALGGLWWLAPPESTPLGWLHIGTFVAAMAVTELLPMRQPGGQPVATSLAITATLALLGASPVLVAAVAGVGWLVARLVEREGLPLGVLALRMVGGWSLAGVAAAGAAMGPEWRGDEAFDGAVASLDVGAAVAVTVATVVGPPALHLITATVGHWAHLPRRMFEAVVRTWMVGAAISSTALLGGLVHEVLGAWTLPTMLIPLLAARVGLDRFAVASRAYDQTIRAMSRLPEQLGAVEHEHGVRVGRLAVRVGLELGLDADSLVDLEHAAHLHELGLVRYDDPDSQVGREDRAAAGASIVRETGSLDRVAAIIDAHGIPRLASGEAALPARIVAAACEVDRYRPEPGDEGQIQEVLVRLVRDIGDLDVVASMARVLKRGEPVA